MPKRKKRLEKGVDSLNRVILDHHEKRKRATELGQEELVHYYDVEIAALKRVFADKKRKRDRG